MSKPRAIRLYPVPGVFVDRWPSREFDATPEEWEDIQTYLPVPFTDTPPAPPVVHPIPDTTEA